MIVWIGIKQTWSINKCLFKDLLSKNQHLFAYTLADCNESWRNRKKKSSHSRGWLTVYSGKKNMNKQLRECFSVVQGRKASWTGALATGGTLRHGRSSTVKYLYLKNKEPEWAIHLGEKRPSYEKSRIRFTGKNNLMGGSEYHAKMLESLLSTFILRFVLIP